MNDREALYAAFGAKPFPEWWCGCSKQCRECLGACQSQRDHYMAHLVGYGERPIGEWTWKSDTMTPLSG